MPIQSSLLLDISRAFVWTDARLCTDARLEIKSVRTTQANIKIGRHSSEIAERPSDICRSKQSEQQLILNVQSLREYKTSALTNWRRSRQGSVWYFLHIQTSLWVNNWLTLKPSPKNGCSVKLSYFSLIGICVALQSLKYATKMMESNKVHNKQLTCIVLCGMQYRRTFFSNLSIFSSFEGINKILDSEK